MILKAPIRRGIGAALSGAALWCVGAADAEACGRPAPAAFNVIVPNGGAHDPELVDAAIRFFTNNARTCAGLAPLDPDPALRRAAAMQSANMTRHKVFAHETPEAGERTMQARIDKAGVAYRRAAENIITAYFMVYEAGRSYIIDNAASCRFSYADTGRRLKRQTYATFGESLVARWMKSPGHRANILTPEMTRHGAALSPTDRTDLCGELYATQVFAG